MIDHVKQNDCVIDDNNGYFCSWKFEHNRECCIVWRYRMDANLLQVLSKRGKGAVSKI